MRASLIAGKVTPRDGYQVRSVCNIELPIVTLPKIAMIHPDMMTLRFARINDANVVPSEAIVFACRIIFPKVSELQVPNDDVMRAMHFENAVMNCRSRSRPENSRVRAHPDFSHRCEFVTRLLV